MPILKDIAQVLRLYEQGNTSLVAVMLGRRLGQFRVHVKGARRWPKKGFEGGFDLLTRGEILVYPKGRGNLWIFKEWDEHVRLPLGQSLSMLRACSYLCELSAALTSETAGSQAEEDRVVKPAHRDGSSSSNDGSVPSIPRLYDLLTASADALVTDVPPGPVLLAFTLRALELEGLLPSLETCMGCKDNVLRNMGPVWFTHEGLRCKKCHASEKNNVQARGILFPPDALKAINHVRKTARPVGLSADGAERLAQAMVLLVQGALERDLQTLHEAAWIVRWMGRKIF